MVMFLEIHHTKFCEQILSIHYNVLVLSTRLMFSAFTSQRMGATKFKEFTQPHEEIWKATIGNELQLKMLEQMTYNT